MENDKDQTVVEVSANGIKLHGVYEDFRPAVQSAVATITHVLSVTENIVGLPADFLKYHLRRFRERYQGVSKPCRQTIDNCRLCVSVA
jgi:hypothetical protein